MTLDWRSLSLPISGSALCRALNPLKLYMKFRHCLWSLYVLHKPPLKRTSEGIDPNAGDRTDGGRVVDPWKRNVTTTRLIKVSTPCRWKPTFSFAASYRPKRRCRAL